MTVRDVLDVICRLILRQLLAILTPGCADLLELIFPHFLGIGPQVVLIYGVLGSNKSNPCKIRAEKGGTAPNHARWKHQ